MLKILFDIFKDKFIGGVFTENQDSDNGGIECANYMTFQFRLSISIVAVIIYYFIYRETLKRLREELLTEEPKKVSAPSVLEYLLGYITIGLFIINCLYKINAKQLVFILNPCHMVGLLEGYLLISPNGLSQRTLYTVLMNTLFSPWIAIFFPVTAGLDAPFEVPLFWIEHFNTALISPLVLSMTHRYYNKSTISLRNHLFSHMMFAYYQRVILFPISQLTYANLNFTLCAASVDPFEKIVGKWYYVVSDLYIFLGGEVFHRLVKVILGILKFLEAKLMNHKHDSLLRKPVQEGKPVTKIPLKNPESYSDLWFDNQEDLDAYDSLMRKKIYYQNSFGAKGEKEFIRDGKKPTFGIFTKDFKERKYEKSSLLKNQEEFIENLENSPEYKKLNERRYHTWSDFNESKEVYIRHFKIFATLLILRELPLKNFYARCFVVGTCLHYFNYHWWWLYGRKPVYYSTERDKRPFQNYPRLNEIVNKRISSRQPSPTRLESDHWWAFQQPVFYHHHIKHYRYIYRHRREVPWDGTYNQPIFPYHTVNDRTAFVHNGILESTEPRGSAAW